MAGGFGLPILNIQGGLAKLGESFSEGYDRGQAPEILEALLKSRGAPGGLAGAMGGGQQPTQSPLGGAVQSPLPAFARMQGGQPSAKIGDILDSASQAYGLDRSYLPRLTMIESGGREDARNPSGAAGLLQFMPKTAQAYGLDNPFDPVASADAGARLTIDNKAKLKGALGRDPTNGELYLGHQQGAAGATALLTNPDANAIDVLARGPYAKARDPIAVATQAVTANGGSPDMTAREFAGKWTSRFDGAGRPTQQPAPGPGPQGVQYADDEAQTQALERRMGMMPRQAASGDPLADQPAPGAIPAGFQIPGQQTAASFPTGLSASGQMHPGGLPSNGGRPSLPSSDPNASNGPAAPATPAPGLPGIGAAQQAGLDPALLARALGNRVTAPFATAAIAAQLKSGDDYSVQAVGDSLYRINKRTGSVELVPGVSKPQTTVVSPGGTLVDQVTGRSIFSAAAKPETVAAGSRLVDPNTGREVYAAPEKPVSVAPGATLYDPSTRQGIYTAPEKSGTPGFVQMNGRLLVTDPDTGSARDVTPRDLPQGFRPATAEERKGYNVPDATPLFIGSDGKPQTLAGQTINVNTGEKAQEQAIGADYGKRFAEMNRAGTAATGQLSTINAMERAMNSPGFYSGTGGPAHLSFNRGLVSLGVKDSKAAAPAELFDALSNKVILDGLGGSLGAGISNGDRDFIQRTAPDLAKTPAGNAQLLGYARALAERQQQVAKFSRDYYAQNGKKLDPGFDDALARWAEENPITPGGRPGGQGAPRGGAPSAPAPAGARAVPQAPAASRFQQLVGSGLSEDAVYAKMHQEGY